MMADEIGAKRKGKTGRYSRGRSEGTEFGGGDCG
jgi:hypothetical protein